MPTTKTRKAAAASFPKKTPDADLGKSPSDLIDARIAELGDWRGERLARLRRVIRATDPDVMEEWKSNVPVWSCCGILCTGEAYKKVVKLTFPKGAALPDPAGIFNASLDGNARRAVDFAEDAAVDEEALAALIHAAIAMNKASRTGKA